jgi:hypothetical protein
VLCLGERHFHNQTILIELAEADGMRDRYLFIVGGPHISHAFSYAFLKDHWLTVESLR